MINHDAVLINPNVGAVNDDVKAGVRIPSRKRQPLDLAYCAAVLEKHGFSCKIIDALILNLSDEEVIDQCKGKYVVINTSPIDRWECPYLSIEKHIALANKIKKTTRAKIIFIGPHGTTTPKWVFEKADIDLVVMGEPEYTVLEIVKGLPYEEIDGIAYKNHEVTVNKPRPYIKNLDELPFPSYHLLPMEKYSDHIVVHNIRPFSLMVTSRGCPFKCTFCFKEMWGNSYRARSIHKVIEEIVFLQKNYGVKAVYFQDLEFCMNKERVVEFCEKLIENKIRLTWACSARLHDIDEKIGKLMKQAGCIHINFGLESGSQKILRNIKKGINLKTASKTIRVIRKIGIRACLFFIIGFPGETRETIKESVRFAVANDIDFLGAGLCVPYPGTQLWDGKLTWDEAGEMAGRIETDILKEFTEEQLLRYVRLFYLKEKYSRLFFLNPSFYLDLMSKVMMHFLLNKPLFNRLR